MPRKRISSPREAFLSHSDVDRAFVTRLARVMRKHGIGAWYSKAHILTGEQWHDRIGAALGRCDWFVIVLSPASVKSKWVKLELMYALQERRYDERILPILLKTCEYRRLSWTLGSFEYADFTTGFARGCRDLFRRWGVEYRSR
jgi:hypothetical protein